MAQHQMIKVGPPLGGMDRRDGAATNAAWLIENMVLEQDDQAWSSIVGYEQFFASALNYNPWGGNLGPVLSCFVWSTHGGSVRHHMFEAIVSGSVRVCYTVGNPASIATVLTGRSTPAANEMVSDWTAHGDRLILVNGFDAPLVMWYDSGVLRTRPLGWIDLPSPPHARFPMSGVAYGNDGVVPMPVGIYNPADLKGGQNEPDVDVGVGSASSPDFNSVTYRVSWVNLDGSESPPSQESTPIRWTTAPIPVVGGDRAQAVLLDSIPRGPAGTVARNLYRDKNNIRGNHYWVDTIPNNAETAFWDASPDSLLGSTLTERTTVLPTRHPYLVASFGGSIWLVDREDPTRVWHSNAGTIDDYDITNYFDLKSEVVRLYPHYDLLLVFRKDGVDAVRITEDGRFSVNTVLEGVGCTAGHSVASIPGLGVVFASDSGVHAFSGGYHGGSTIGTTLLSAPVSDVWRRVNLDLLPRATAVWSHRWREYHLYTSVDGNPATILGFVLHVPEGGSPAWSIRTGWPVSCVAVNPEGDIIFGHNVGSSGSPTTQQGLFVISRRRSMGERVQSGQIMEAADPPTSVYQTIWHDMGNMMARKKPVKFTMQAKVEGSGAPSVAIRRDWQSSTQAGVSQSQLPTEMTVTDIYGTAVWDTASWTEEIPVEITYDVGDIHSCARYRYEISSSENFRIGGYIMGVIMDDVTIDQLRRKQ